MHIVTLTTDFGIEDYYTAALKGALLCQQANLNIVDISHNIKNFDIVQAAYIFKNTWYQFPQKSIHIVSVGESIQNKPSFLFIQHQGHFFLGPDNGIFSLIFEEMPNTIYRLPNHIEKYSSRQIYADALGHVTSGKAIEKIGSPIKEYLCKINLQAVISPSQIRGSVIYIDNYENAITNISKQLFDQVGSGRSFSLFFKRNDPIGQLSQNYQDVAIGDNLCRFNESGQLEIAINMGKASSLLGLNVDDTIQIDFHN